MSWRIADIGGDPEAIQNLSGRYFYRLARITWSRPTVWRPENARPPIPQEWAEQGGIYCLLRDHHAQKVRRRIAYVGKAISFRKRLTRNHHMFEHLVNKQGDTLVSLGRIRFERIQSSPGYYEEIEQIVAWTVWHHLENGAGLETVPGFRGQMGRPFAPWVIINEGYRFNGQMPRRLVYPAIGFSDG
ncbi:MAG: hypothetical protein P1U49_02025 [Minwuia sp.]|nr:hypothetical protein [Minwuia sp.]